MRASFGMPVCLILIAAGCGGEEAGRVGGAGGAGGAHAKVPTVLPEGEATLALVADAQDDLHRPRDLAFDPQTGDLWIVNRGDESVTIVFEPTTGSRHSEHRKDGYALHFMAKVVSIDFGDRTFRNESTFGTCGESENTYDEEVPPNFFMGPVLWSADLDVFAVENPIGLGSHLDMLHESPDCVGIAHVQDNVFWAFDGYHGQLARYDFANDHGPGMDDHSDGIIEFLDAPEVLRQPGVPSHMEWDSNGQVLYVADTGNRRVLRIDPAPAHRSRDLDGIEPGTVVRELTGAAWSEIVPPSAGLQVPSGLALYDGVLYVGDNATGVVHAFDADGHEVAKLETGLAPGALMGIEVGPDERLYLVDGTTPRVLRAEP